MQYLLGHWIAPPVLLELVLLKLEPVVLEPDNPDELELWTELVVVVGPSLVALPPVALAMTTGGVHDAAAASGKVRHRTVAR
jgi:hypothetical protein